MSINRSIAPLMTLLVLTACGGKHITDNIGSNSTALPAQVCAQSDHVGMPTEERIYSWIEDLVGIGFRRTGTPAGYAASAYVKCQFESLGLENVHYEYADSWKWEVNDSSVEVDGVSIDAFPSAFSFIEPGKPSAFSTGNKGIEADIVDVGLGVAIEQQLVDVKGKVILFDLKFIMSSADLMHLAEFTWDPDQTLTKESLSVANPYMTTYSRVLRAAMDAGAVGFIGVLADYFESNQYYNEFYRRTSVTIPGYWVSPKEGAKLRKILASKGEGTKARLVMEGSRDLVQGRSVIGYLPGKSKDTIMVQSHHDSVFYGAVEDGSGTAAVLAQAQHFASQPAETREKTLMFATFDTHFTGYQSHMAFVEKYIKNQESPYNIVANVTLEHIGKQGLMDGEGQLVTSELPEMRGILNTLSPALKDVTKKAIVEHDLKRSVLLSAHAMCAKHGMPTDASFVCLNGVPTISLVTGPNYLYDIADSLDKVDRAQLVPVTKAFIDIIEAINSTPSNQIGASAPSAQ